MLLKRTGYSSPGLGQCLRVVTEAALLLELAFKLSLGEEITLYASHQIGPLLHTKGSHWLTNNYMLQYQVTLIENPQVKIANCTVLNPATLGSASNKKLSVLEANDELRHNLSGFVIVINTLLAVGSIFKPLHHSICITFTYFQ